MHLKKLVLLNRRQWQENKNAYCIGMLAMFGILAFLFLISWHFRESFNGDVIRGIFLLGLFIGGGLFASSLLHEVKQPGRGIWLIGIPASAGEKLAVAVFYALLLYLAFYLSAFYIIEGVFQWLIQKDQWKVQRTDLLKNGFYNFLFSFIIIQLIIILGSLSFKRVAFLKTVLLLIAWFNVSNLINNRWLAFLTGEQHINAGSILSGFQFIYNGENVYVHLSPGSDQLVTVMINYLLPVILYYINYLKFKETEL